MFDQTFVDGTQKTSKPISVFISTLIQIYILGILLLIPLIYTATLPGTMFKSLLVAPAPPGIVKETPVKVQHGRVLRVFTARSIFAPIAIPKQVNPSGGIARPPDVPTGLADSADRATDPLPGSLLGSAPAPAPMAEQPKSKPVARSIRVGLGVAEANLIDKVVPLYPPLAKAARIQGIVEFSAIISKEGNIEHLQLIHGHPLLVRAARDAVLQWKYRPTLLNGEPVEVLTEIVVNFTLAQ